MDPLYLAWGDPPGYLSDLAVHQPAARDDSGGFTRFCSTSFAASHSAGRSGRHHDPGGYNDLRHYNADSTIPAVSVRQNFSIRKRRLPQTSVRNNYCAWRYRYHYRQPFKCCLDPSSSPGRTYAYLWSNR